MASITLHTPQGDRIKYAKVHGIDRDESNTLMILGKKDRFIATWAPGSWTHVEAEPRER